MDIGDPPEKNSTIERIARETTAMRQMLINRRQATFDRFPLLFTLLGTFGLVATFYGFEHLIDRVPLFVDNPIILLITGVATLLFTGKLYQKL